MFSAANALIVTNLVDLHETVCHAVPSKDTLIHEQRSSLRKKMAFFDAVRTSLHPGWIECRWQSVPESENESLQTCKSCHPRLAAWAGVQEGVRNGLAAQMGSETEDEPSPSCRRLG